MSEDVADRLYEYAVRYAAVACGGSLISEQNLRGACGRPFQTFDGTYLHDGMAARAAALFHGIVTAHAFDDGNKRTGWMVTIYYLGSHGWFISGISEDEGEDFVIGMIAHRYELPDVREWIASHIRPIHAN